MSAAGSKSSNGSHFHLEVELARWEWCLERNRNKESDSTGKKDSARGVGCEDCLEKLCESLLGTDSAGASDGSEEECVVVEASSCRLFRDHCLINQHDNEAAELSRENESARWINTTFLAMCIPSGIVYSAVERDFESSKFCGRRADCPALRRLIHPCLANLSLCGIIVVAGSAQETRCDQGRDSRPVTALYDVLLARPSPGSESHVLSQVVSVLHGEPMAACSFAVMKPILVRATRISVDSTATTKRRPEKLPPSDDNWISRLELPFCPVCLHRLNPPTTASPMLKTHQICSHRCSPSPESPHVNYCSNAAFLRPWPTPSHCEACQVIAEYALVSSVDLLTSTPMDPDLLMTATTLIPPLPIPAEVGGDHNAPTEGGDRLLSDMNGLRAPGKPMIKDPLLCYQCGMRETLWLCLTCGVVGCGRYSHAHAKDHSTSFGHPFALELATGRIWDHSVSEFVHRTDLPKCSVLRRFPQSATTSRAHASNNAHQDSRDAVDWKGSFGSDDNAARSNLPSDNSEMIPRALDESAPKKAIMIGEEYEALLQSALEEQAQHFEGQITRLRAELTAQQIDERTLSKEELQEIQILQEDIAELRREKEALSRDLLDAQAQEAGHRATSQRLLREQSVARGVLDKICAEAAREHANGKLQIEELEQQVSDLTANLMMRNQIAQDEELSNAHIFGTTTEASEPPLSSNKGSRRNKKKGKSNRR